jgi:hypothetical protein
VQYGDDVDLAVRRMVDDAAAIAVAPN